MAARKQAQVGRVYEEFEPPSDVVSDDKSETFLLYLPGFKKEQLRVQLTTSRMLKISGERPIGENRWRRFHKEVRVPSNCDTKEITAKFEGGILYIRQPKLITVATEQQDKEKAAVQPPKTQPPPAAPFAQPALPRPPLPPTRPILPPPQQPPTQPVAPLPTPPPPKTEEKKEKEIRREVEDNARKTYEKETLSDEAKTEEPARLGFFKELSKPGNRKRLIITTLVILMLGMYVSYMLKLLRRDDDKNQN